MKSSEQYCSRDRTNFPAGLCRESVLLDRFVCASEPFGSRESLKPLCSSADGARTRRLTTIEGIEAIRYWLRQQLDATFFRCLRLGISSITRASSAVCTAWRFVSNSSTHPFARKDSESCGSREIALIPCSFSAPRRAAPRNYSCPAHKYNSARCPCIPGGNPSKYLSLGKSGAQERRPHVCWSSPSARRAGFQSFRSNASPIAELPLPLRRL